MEIPQAMLLDWAKRLYNSGLSVNPQEVKKVEREIATYATSNEQEQRALRQFFYNHPEN